MRIAVGVAVLVLSLSVSCKRDEDRNEGLPKNTAPGKTAPSDIEAPDSKVAPGSDAAPGINTGPVQPEQLESIEVVLAESEKEGHEGEIKVYVILYDLEQNMASSNGKLELTYTTDGVDEQTKVKELEAAVFRKQVIPGEEEPTLAFLADNINIQPGQTLKVVARFADLLESDDTITLEEASAVDE